MYEEFKTTPFDLESDLNFIFLGQNYEIPLAMLVSGLDKGVQLHSVLGQDGVGKTTFVNYVYKHIQHNCTVGLVDRPIDSFSTLLQFALESFGHKAEKVDMSSMLNQLNTVLTSEYAKSHGQPSLLIIDDAHKIAPGILKRINNLFAFNKDARLLQLILVGNNELQGILNQAISKKVERLWHHLKPLTSQETTNYIHHRLKIAGTTNKNLFNEQVCSAIYVYSKGIPQRINSLCHRLLHLSNEEQLNKISTDHIRVIADDEEQIGNSLSSSVNDTDDSSSWFFKEGRVAGLIFAGIGLVSGFIVAPFITEPDEPQIATSKNTVNKPDKNKWVAVAPPAKISEIKTKIPLNPEIEPSDRPNNSISNNIQQASESAGVLSEENKVEKLLAVAERQLSNSNLLTPKNDNAYDTYTAILIANPNEKRATSGLKRIADRYLTLAEKKFNEVELLQSKRLIARGLKVSPENKELIALNKQVEQKNKSQKQQHNIQTLVKQGNQQIVELKLISPKGDNAYQSYLDIFAYDKSNRQAEQGVKKIQRLLKSQIYKALNNKEHNSAMEIANQILSAPSKEQYLQDALTTAHEAENMVSNKIANLLSRADQLLESKQLTHPAGSNATETYRTILNIDQSNTEAKAGLQNIVEQYSIFAEDALADGKTKQALIYANKAVKAFPENTKLLKLQNRISFLLSEQNLGIAANNIAQKNKRTELKKQLRPFGNF